MKRHYWILLGILICQAVIYYGFAQRERLPEVRPWEALPRQIGNWMQDQDLPMDAESMQQLQPDVYISRGYVAGRATSPAFLPASLFIAYFRTQRTGHAPHSPQDCLPGAGWEPVSARVLPIDVPQMNTAIEANEYIVKRAGTEMAVYYWYQTARRTAATELQVQFRAVPELLVHGRTDVALVRVITPMPGGDLAPAKAASLDFIRALFPVVKSLIPA